MATNPLSVRPVVGSKGVFTLAAPFDAQIADGVLYTCQSDRRISDYIGQNEDVKADIYDRNTIAEDIWEEDKQADASIIALQAETGQWIYVPARYVIGYPNVNGTPYRSYSLSVALPPLPVSRDLTDVMEKITAVVRGSLGVPCKIDPIETSRISLIDSALHDQTTTARNIIIGQPGTDASKAIIAQRRLDEALIYIKQLEDWIQANHPVKDVPVNPNP